MDFVTRKKVYEKNETMLKLLNENMFCDEADINNILNGLGVEMENGSVWLADKNDILWLAVHFVALGRVYERQEQRRAKKLKEGNNV